MSTHDARDAASSFASAPETVFARPRTGVPTATYTYVVAEDRWEWSEAMFRLHGFEPGDVVPTTALVMSHQHPDDRNGVAGILAATVAGDGPFVSRHRIVDAAGHERMVVAFAIPERDADGCVRVLRGVIAEVTEQIRNDIHAATKAAVRGATASRAGIDQAKGALMAHYGIGDEAAFDVLRVLSSRTNIKVVDLAETVLRHLTTQQEPRPAPAVASELESSMFDQRPPPTST